VLVLHLRAAACVIRNITGDINITAVPNLTIHLPRCFVGSSNNFIVEFKIRLRDLTDI
jgi:hypothetical protein